MQQKDETPRDPVVARLAAFFGEHPAWLSAAAKLQPEASSTVHFSHLPGQVWQLALHGGRARLEPGPAPDPDLVFLFTPAAVGRLAGVDGAIGDFAVELFRLLAETRPHLQVRLRVVASFTRLVQRGYLGLLAAGGWGVLAFGATRGVRTIAQLRRLVEEARRSQPERWEQGKEILPTDPRSDS
jgi:hypothetical protein